jgi:serine/threonine protein phosphatase PrpC
MFVFVNLLIDALVFLNQIFDGHNGSRAAIYSKEHLLNNVMSVIPTKSTKEEWLAALPQAMVVGFVKTDNDLKKQGNLPTKNFKP